eukprot:scaffold11160_cov118-Skeletonema_marinoi.AAC.2
MEVAVGIEVGRRVRGYTKDEMINDYLPAARMATELCRHSSVSHEFDDDYDNKARSEERERDAPSLHEDDRVVPPTLSPPHTGHVKPSNDVVTHR